MGVWKNRVQPIPKDYLIILTFPIKLLFVGILYFQTDWRIKV